MTGSALQYARILETAYGVHSDHHQGNNIEQT